MGISRRDILAGAGAIAATAATSKAMAQSFVFKPNQRYPDPALEVLDPSFLKYRIYSSTVEQIAIAMRLLVVCPAVNLPYSRMSAIPPMRT